VRVAAPAGTIEPTLVGENVRVTIPVAALSSDGEVLAVPLAALVTTGSGDTIVVLANSDGSTRNVVIVPGLVSSDGYVEIVGAEGDIADGDLVVVGAVNGAPSGS
jgi:multidrug efflux pump subunit AcrA (membrane-fusion protein)